VLKGSLRHTRQSASAISHCKKHHATLDIDVQAREKRQRTFESSVNDLTMSGNENHASSLSEVLLSMVVESGYGGLLDCT
jgi:hypothetical protein